MTRSELAHAKVNLSLRVLAREAGGYHQIETLFCTLELADEVEVRVVDGVHLQLHAPFDDPGSTRGVPANETNLAWRAAAEFTQRAGTSGAHVSLTKRIPHGAGLGGGSSDAAAVLRALNALHDDVLPMSELFAIAAQLGSDVPFFLTGAALALAWGRGDRLLPLPPLPSKSILLAMPEQRTSTADVYHALAAARGAGFVSTSGLALSADATWSDVAADSVNDFEDIVFARIDGLAALHHQLRDSGARLARLTGTGSVVFGVFDNGTDAERARDLALGSGARVWLTRTRGHVVGDDG